MVAGVSAGQAKVTVVPDLARFASKLRHDLRDIEKTVKATITANLKLDTAEARTELDRFAASAVQLRATIDTSSLIASVRRGIRDAQRYARTNPVKLATTLEIDRAAIRAQINSITGGNVTIRFNLDITSARARAEIFHRYLVALFNNIPIGFDIRNSGIAGLIAQLGLLNNAANGSGSGGSRRSRGLLGTITGMISGIARLGGTIIPAFTNILGGMGNTFAQLGSWLGGLSTSLQGLGGLLGMLGTRMAGMAQVFSESVGPIAGPVLQIVSMTAAVGVAGIALSVITALVVQLAGALLVAAGSITALSAGAVGLAAILGGVIIGVQGVGTAISALASGDTKALKAAMKDLTPSAQAFVAEISKLLPAFREIKRQTQESLFRGMSVDLQNAARVSLPAFTLALQQGARTANIFARELLKAFAMPRVAGDLSTTILNLGPGFDHLMASIKPLTAGFLDLAKAASGPLGGFLDDMGKNFSDFGNTLQNIAKDPAFEGFLTKALQSFSQLGSIIGSVVRILSGLSTAAAAGGVSFAGFADMFTRLADYVSSPAGQLALANFFATAQDAVNKLMPFLESVGSAIGTIVDIAVTLAPAFADFLSSTLAPLLNNFSKFWTIIKPFAPLIGGILLGAIIALGVAVLFILSPFIALGIAIAAIGAIIALVVMAIVSGVTFLVNAFISALPAIGGFFAGVGNFFAGLGVAIGGFFAGIGVAIAGWFMGIVASVTTFVGGIQTAIRNWLTSMGAAIAAGWNFVVMKISAAIGSIIGFVSGLVSRVVAFFTSLGNGIRTAVSNGINAVVGFFQALPGRVISILNSLISRATNAGAAIVQGIANGISGAIGAVTGSIQNVMNAIANFLPHSPAKTGPLSGKGWSLFSGQAIGDALAEGLASRQGAVESAMAALLAPASLASAGGDFVGSALLNHELTLANQQLTLQVGGTEMDAYIVDKQSAHDTSLANSLLFSGARPAFT